ncbi:MAG: site-specific integrase [Pseudomonadota bacterium]
MATITKTSSGTWKALIRRKGWPTTVKTFRRERDAQDWARRIEDEMIRGIYIHRAPAEKMTVAEALDRYLREVTPTKRPSTQKNERKKAKNLLEYLGKYGLVAVTPQLVAQYRDTRLSEGRADNTVRLELALLSHLYTTAIREWDVGLTFNPVGNIRKPSPGQGRERRLEPDEEKRLIEACTRASNPMLGWIVRLALETGMRAGEIVGLRRKHVDLHQRYVLLPETKNGTPRTVPLTREATRILSEAASHPIRPIDTDLIFWGEPGHDGKRRGYQFQPAWYRALKQAGIQELRFHDLRHEAISRMVEAGLSDQEVSAISGHKSMQMLRRYSHLRSQHLVQKLDSLGR